MPRGRTEKMDYRQVKTLMHEFGKRDLKFKEIADIFCVTPQTVTRYMQRHPEIRKAYNEGRGNLIKGLKGAAFKKALGGDVPMLKYMLNNLTNYAEQPLIDQSQHTHIKYEWNNHNDTVQPADVPSRDTSRLSQV